MDAIRPRYRRASGRRDPRVTRPLPLVAIVALLTILLAPPVAAEPLAPPAFADAEFAEVWERYDRPVFYGQASRSFTWGGGISDGLAEPYREGPEGKHLVQYFDKSRMEINDPNGDKSNAFFVTQGLLARDMIRGEVQEGDTAFRRVAPAQVPFGDLDDVAPASPTYASFSRVLDARPFLSGQALTATLDRAGKVGKTENSYGVTSAGVPPGATTGHAIASVFYEFLQSIGPVYEGGQTVATAVFDPLFYVTGFPITEAYWARVKAGEVRKDVLIQCFERRCLTYTPGNDPDFRVELANTGLQYYEWRYRTLLGDQTPPAISNVAVTGFAATGVTIAWRTDEPATSEVFYGATNRYDKVQADRTLVTEHAVTLRDLVPNGEYHYAIESADAAGNRAATADAVFIARPQAFTAWARVGGTLIDAPAAATLDGRVHVFYRGADNAIYETHSADDGATFSAPRSLGGAATSAPAAVNADGVLYLFVRGSDNGLYEKHSDDGDAFTAWRPLGGTLGGAPAVVSLNGRISVFIQNPDNTVSIRQSFDGVTFSAPRSLGGSLTGSPAATGFRDGLYLFATGIDNAVYEKHSTDGGATFTAWRSLAGVATSGPAVAVYTPPGGVETLFVFARGIDNALYARYSSTGATFTTWYGLGGQLTSGPAAASRVDRLFVFARWTDNALWERRTTP